MGEKMKWIVLSCGLLVGIGVGYVLPRQPRYAVAVQSPQSVILVDGGTGATWALDRDPERVWTEIPKRDAKSARLHFIPEQ